ncbi:ABC transporter ATP-binding protein [Pontiella sulfatireligans]|uniref:Multidrug export ATP-binding/permease protein n=1 Tax=Pontiella sulfatireligans TaxID=2750658 RepID=A0A6C2ULA2_9BACT|nr:ABC transporter transmembrane domain-containing protein [Pontiella sulfatireligans]VGO20197.1 Putative multidrug export ATP-binding/permease protein [Pontiella sulfatireligans]
MKKDEVNPPILPGVYKRLLVFVRPYTARLTVGIICGAFYGAATFGMLIALQWALGGISGESMDFKGIPGLSESEGNASDIGLTRLILTVLILPLVTIIQGALFFAGKYLVEWVGNRVVADLRLHLFEHIHVLPMQFFSENRVGDLISRITNDTNLLTQLVSNVIGNVIREPFTLIGCIVAMVVLDWRLSVIALVVFPVVILPVALLGRRIRKASKTGQESRADMLSVVQESVGGALVVKAFQMEQEEASRFNQFNRRVFKSQMRQTRARSMGDPIVIFLSSIGLSGVVLYAFFNDISLALLIAFAAAMIQMYKPAKKLSQIHMRVQKATPGIERVFEVLDIVNKVDDAPDAVQLADSVQTVSFRHVSFAYDEKKILDDINLDVKSGQCIAFVGSSGAGKTTLVNLLPRFFDVTEGALMLNGKDVRNYTVHSLRAQIGVVTQDTVLFNRSVADNISYGFGDASRELIEDAARRANAHDFILELENGYDTVIGERGSLLSGGMAQRVAIARALLKNPPILILDEATSALDTESERLVQGALDELMKDRTVFVIAHRLSTIAHADAIIVMDQGKIVERGTHDELLKQDGRYKYLYDIQFSAATA